MSENIKVSEVSDILRKQLEGINANVQLDEIGTVLQVSDGVVRIYGLRNAEANELLEFDDGSIGIAQNLEEEVVSIAVLSDEPDIHEGTEVRRTGRIVSVPVGEALLGRVVHALGGPIDGKGPINCTETRPIEAEAPGIIRRKSVSVPLQTGIKAIDSMIPIGRGQRELIIGDRQTGKTSIAIDTIINQRGKDVICIYVAIGQKNSLVAQITETLQKAGAMDYTVIVCASASESAPVQYIVPYSGCAMAEYFREKGKDVLIVYDDLSKHAVAYRALSLLIRRDAKHIPAMYSTCIRACLNVQPVLRPSTAAVLSRLCPSSRHRRVTCPHTSRQTLFPSRTDRFSLKRNSSIQVFAPQSTPAFRSAVSAARLSSNP